MNRWAIPLVSTLCTVAMIATAFPSVAAEPSVKKKTSGGSALDKPTFGEKFTGSLRREKRTGVKVRQKGDSKQKGAP
jgi:hypothetical protein